MATRIKLRTDTYANWDAANANAPGGLKILQGEVCVILADAASAAAGLSNAVVDLVTPLIDRLPNTGEVLGTKIGQGFAVRWDLIPTNFHIPRINYPNGTGRVLGTRNNGQSHVYDHPGKMFRAIFQPVYSGPDVAARLSDGNNTDLNGALLEVGQLIAGVNVTISSTPHSYRIKQGDAYESTTGQVQLGLDETAAAPLSIGTFQRALAPFSLVPGNSGYDGGSGTYRRSFYGTVLDERPGAEGGNNLVGSGGVNTYATYPTFFGKSNQPLPTDPAAVGAFLQANATPLIRTRQNYSAGKLAYRNGERPLFGYPAAWGPLSQILDELGLNQLGYSGAAFGNPLPGLVSKAGQYQNVPYLFYTTFSGFNGDILFTFQF